MMRLVRLESLISNDELETDCEVHQADEMMMSWIRLVRGSQYFRESETDE